MRVVCCVCVSVRVGLKPIRSLWRGKKNLSSRNDYLLIYIIERLFDNEEESGERGEKENNCCCWSWGDKLHITTTTALSALIVCRSTRLLCLVFRIFPTLPERCRRNCVVAVANRAPWLDDGWLPVERREQSCWTGCWSDRNAWAKCTNPTRFLSWGGAEMAKASAETEGLPLGTLAAKDPLALGELHRPRSIWLERPASAKGPGRSGVGTAVTCGLRSGTCPVLLPSASKHNYLY